MAPCETGHRWEHPPALAGPRRPPNAFPPPSRAQAHPFEAPGTPIRAGPTRPRWRWPGPLALFALVWVGLAVWVLATIDGEFGKGPIAVYGFPFPCLGVPRHPDRAGSPSGWFSPAALVANLAIIAAMLGASVSVAQRLADGLGLSPRVSIRSLCGLIAAVALVLASLRFAIGLAWLILTAGFFFGALSPFLWLAILAVRCLEDRSQS